MTFLIRFLSMTLAATCFAAAIVVLLQLHPVGAPGWAAFIALSVGTFALPWFVYRALMRRVRDGGYPDEGEGAGLAMGAGIDASRRRREDDDTNVDPFDID